jgi:hypothetical protein
VDRRIWSALIASGVAISAQQNNVVQTAGSLCRCMRRMVARPVAAGKLGANACFTCVRGPMVVP